MRNDDAADDPPRGWPRLITVFSLVSAVLWLFIVPLLSVPWAALAALSAAGGWGSDDVARFVGRAPIVFFVFGVVHWCLMALAFGH